MPQTIASAPGRRADAAIDALGALRDLNRQFLDLLAAGEDGLRRPPRGGLSADVSSKLVPLSAAQRAAAASCPYALFDLRFDDERHWRVRFAQAPGWRVAEEAVAQGGRADLEAAQFTQLAVFYAWHVAAAAKLADRVLLGMTEGTAEVLRGIALNRLPALALGESARLTARWSSSSRFWSALAGAAACTDPAVLRRVQLSGLQLAAAAGLP